MLPYKLYDHKHAVIAKSASKWPHHAEHVLEIADMLVSYCQGTAPKRPGEIVDDPNRKKAGKWRRIPYGGALWRAYQLLAIRRGNHGCITLRPSWRMRLEECGIDPETMDVKPGCELQWARAWKQWCDTGTFTLERQREWNAMGVEAEWPPPLLSWEARTNSKKVRDALKEEARQAGRELPAEVAEEPEVKPRKFDLTSSFRKRISMRVEAETAVEEPIEAVSLWQPIPPPIPTSRPTVVRNKPV